VEICDYVHRYLIEIAKYICKHSASMNVYYLPYNTNNKRVSENQTGSMANIVDDYTGKKQKTQQSTMSEITHHHHNKGDDPFNYSHDTCPTCQDRLIVESDVEGCESRICCECCDFGCPECQCRWDEVEEWVENFLQDDNILSKLKDEEITASRARNLLYKFLIRVYCGPLGKGVRMELPDDRCLKGVRPQLKSKDRNKEYTGFKPVSKCSKSSSD